MMNKKDFSENSIFNNWKFEDNAYQLRQKLISDFISKNVEQDIANTMSAYNKTLLKIFIQTDLKV